MNSTLLIKLLGGLTATAGVGTGGYLLKEHFKKSEEKSKEVKEEQDKQNVGTATEVKSSTQEDTKGQTLSTGSAPANTENPSSPAVVPPAPKESGAQGQTGPEQAAGSSEESSSRSEPQGAEPAASRGQADSGKEQLDAPAETREDEVEQVVDTEERNEIQ